MRGKKPSILYRFILPGEYVMVVQAMSRAEAYDLVKGLAVQLGLRPAVMGEFTVERVGRATMGVLLWKTE